MFYHDTILDGQSKILVGHHQTQGWTLYLYNMNKTSDYFSKSNMLPFGKNRGHAMLM